MSERRKGRAFVVALVAVIGLHVGDSRAQTSPSPEDVEAAYIHKFIGYIDWPPRVFPGPAAPVVVGVAGSSRMFELLSSAASGRPAQGRPVEVRRLDKPDQVEHVHMVFVGREAWPDLSAWVSAASHRAVVVTTDAPQGVDRGAMLAFVQSGQRVRFEASLVAAERAGVKMSARLLAVAERVVGPGP